MIRSKRASPIRRANDEFLLHVESIVELRLSPSTQQILVLEARNQIDLRQSSFQALMNSNFSRKPCYWMGVDVTRLVGCDGAKKREACARAHASLFGTQFRFAGWINLSTVCDQHLFDQGE